LSSTRMPLSALAERARKSSPSGLGNRSHRLMSTACPPGCRDHSSPAPTPAVRSADPDLDHRPAPWWHVQASSFARCSPPPARFWCVIACRFAVLPVTNAHPESTAVSSRGYLFSHGTSCLLYIILLTRTGRRILMQLAWPRIASVIRSSSILITAGTENPITRLSIVVKQLLSRMRKPRWRRTSLTIQ
jgi:hypothetical protein